MSSAGKEGSRGSANEAVQVIVRCRPMSDREGKGDCRRIVNVYPSRGVIEVENPKARSDNESTKMFTYDAVYDWGTTQQAFYDENIRPLVTSVLEGYNGCVFAYGQTGTGKTFTMEGVEDDDDLKGIIPRTFEQIWGHINRTTGLEFLVSVRYMEIYMEDIRDLLKSKNNKTLELREQSGVGVVVKNLHSQTCQSAGDMFRAMKTGTHNRITGATNMNEHSSRSHAIFQVVIEMAETQSSSVKVGKLNLIDLAGSERQSKTGATGERLKEATKINKALSALGNVIYALAENSAHIPYRDSKLTRLLQDSLGGNSKTIMVANVGPACMNYDETVVTLRYAYRAKSIKNQPIKNEDIKDAKLLELQKEIERLKALIAEKSHGQPYVVDEADGDGEDGDDENGDAECEMGEENSIEVGDKEKQIEMGKMEIDELAKKLKTLEKQMVHGGKNIVDSVNENELKLERHKGEIAARKKREIEMQQRIELEEETCTELKQVFASLQQQVDFRKDRLRRLLGKLQSVRQEIQDNHEDYLVNRRELEEINDELAVQLRKYFLIIDNFIPPDERSRLLNLAHFDEEQDNWSLGLEHMMDVEDGGPPPSPMTSRMCRRPVSEHALSHMEQSVRYRRENLLDLKLDMPLRTTQSYAAPKVCPQVKAAVLGVICSDQEGRHVVVKLPAHVGSRMMSKFEQEGKYRSALKTTVEVRNLKCVP